MIPIKPAPFKGYYFNRPVAKEQAFPAGVTVGDLRRFIADLPDEMKLITTNGSEEQSQPTVLKVHAMQRYFYHGKDEGIYSFAGEYARGSGGGYRKAVTEPENVLEA